MARSREDEVHDLSESDRHIAESERRIMHQAALVEELRRRGLDATEAERMLSSFKDVLETMHAHRALIVDVIRSIDAGLI